MVFYIGNKLSRHGRVPSGVETLGGLLQQYFDIYGVSDKKNRIVRLFDIVFSLWRKRAQVRVVLIDTFSSNNFYYAWVSAAVCRWLGLPYIPILRGGRLPERIKHSPWLTKYYFKKAETNVAPSGYLFEVMQQEGLPAVLIPNNIELSRYPFMLRSFCRPRILYVRSFHKIYNPALAVRVLAEVKKKHADVELCMVGPDKDGSRQEVETLAAELGVNDNLVIPGFLSKSDWIKLSKDYDIFINTTNFDNMPVSVMEAMALGFPIVSTRVGGIPYLIADGQNGLLVEPGNVTAFTSQVLLLLENPAAAANLSQAARDTAAQFSWNVVGPKWKELLSRYH
jgi:glycosyltransferase involved in cell wall biosynthesis